MPMHPRSLDTTIHTSRAHYDIALAQLERDTIRQVGTEMLGQDAAAVHAELVSRFSHRLPGVELDDRNLRKVAAAISARSFRGL
jgi:hypothetical protein